MGASTKRKAAEIQKMIAQYFSERGINVRSIYRTVDMPSLGSPHNLVPKEPVSARVTVFLDFNNDNIRLDNFRRIIAFPESVASALPYIEGRAGKQTVMKVDLEALPAKYGFRNWDDLGANYSRIFAA